MNIERRPQFAAAGAHQLEADLGLQENKEAGTRATPLGGGKLRVQCDPAPRAEYYQIWIQIVNTDADFHLVESPAEREMIDSDLPSRHTRFVNSLKCFHCFFGVWLVLLVGCAERTIRPTLKMAPAELFDARQALYRQATFTTYLSAAGVSSPRRLFLTQPSLCCFPTAAKGKEQVASSFVADLERALRAEFGRAQGFQAADTRRAADALVRIEITTLYCGRGYADPFTAGLLGLLAITPTVDPAIAECHVFFLNPSTGKVTSAFSKRVTGSPSDLANSLARAVVEGSTQLANLVSTSAPQ